jgi:tRNA threonylcarbamoyladenosine biosynthesis protein TsaB
MLLAIEAATPVASVALLRGDGVVAEVATGNERSLSERLLHCIDELLVSAGVALAQLDAYAVSIGPGSFTSLRVGIATLTGFALGSGLPVLPVPTLAALALAGEAEAGGAAVAVLDAGRGELYAAAYRPGTWEPLAELPESVYSPRTLLERMPVGATLIGEGVSQLQHASEPSGGSSTLRCMEERVSAAQVGRLAVAMWRAGARVSAESIFPRYLRRAEAEARRTGEALEA